MQDSALVKHVPATVGERLAEERQRLALTQEEMAKLGGVSKRSQIDYEKERAEPKSGYLAALLEQHVDVLYVLTGIKASESIAREATLTAKEAVNRVAAVMDEMGLQGALTMDQIRSLIEFTVDRGAGADEIRQFLVAAQKVTGKPYPLERLDVPMRESAPVDYALNQNSLAACIEALEEERPDLPPARKAIAIIALYELVRHSPKMPQKATLLQFARGAA